MPARVTPAHPAPGENWYLEDPPLADLLRPYLPPSLEKEAEQRLTDLGHVAPAQVDPLARLADRHRPILHRRSAEGERVDAVEFHTSYRELQRIAREHEVFTLAWRDRPRALGFALGYLYAQAECGYYCPACMTDGAAYVLQQHGTPELKARYVQRLVSKDVNEGYEGAMYLTEKGGGSDVGGGTGTRAKPAGDGTWRLTGEKWFASNCVADVALALARMPSDQPGTAGLGLFVVPRTLPDGSPNPGLRIERLKDKLGVTSMPTGEVLLEDAVAYMVAPEREGFKIMAEMVNLSRLYNAVASVAIARRAVREGQRAGRAREAFGTPLREHALFLRTLAGLAVEVEGALAFTLDTADAWDRGERALLRALTPCAKAMTAKLAVRAASEACEMLGGVGYIEDYVTPRLLRDAQVLPIWEGTTSVQVLEFLRAAEKAQTLDAFVAHARARLSEAGAQAETAPARQAVERALTTLLDETRALADQGATARQLAGPRLMALAYHAHATVLLLRTVRASRDPDRAKNVANLYAALFLAATSHGADEALAQAVASGAARAIAYPVQP